MRGGNLCKEQDLPSWFLIALSLTLWEQPISSSTLFGNVDIAPEEQKAIYVGDEEAAETEQRDPAGRLPLDKARPALHK